MSKRLTLKLMMGDETKKHLDVHEDCTYEQLLNDLEINPETVLVLHEGQAVALDANVDSGNVSILKIVSGG
ncbi:hypothetical protein [Methanosalsum natronophilum]|uniref:hypothetical protein n=1 Tax=Methanosalsum natronophilum TaxID=768733 RepID=UPI00216AA78B|nr:hypothetical protein [Methanosalsum natronophilum]MCS3924049.1 sulfur carrier protein [Methanosalsum natronophilum]